MEIATVAIIVQRWVGGRALEGLPEAGARSKG